MLEHLTWLLPALKESYKSRDDFKDFWSKTFGKKSIVFTGQTDVRTDNFRWETVPVCAWLDDFVWNNETRPSVLKVDDRDHFIADFADEMANYCK